MGRSKFRRFEKSTISPSYSGSADAEEALPYSKHKHHMSIDNKE
jgi:hypothetical protein